jgi:hypothetical protein
VLAAISAAALAACGSRAEPERVPLPPALQVNGGDVECLVDEDCDTGDLCTPRRCEQTRCVDIPVSCDDDDPCTEDACEPATGICHYEPSTIDGDGDGFRRPLPGFLPGQDGACGDDCNDTNVMAAPGGLERCDGVDNDCDGIVDNGALFSPSQAEPIVLSGAADQGTAGGLTFSDSAFSYGAVFTQRVGASQTTFTSIETPQGRLGEAIPVTQVNNDTFAGPIVGRGQVFATAWEDRRDEDYEIYFNRLNTSGEKLGPDLRITQAEGFSLRPTLLEIQSGRGDEYRLAWEDEREGGGGRIYGQILDVNGKAVGGNKALTPQGLDPSAPQLVPGQTRLGLLFNRGEMLTLTRERRLAFRSFDYDFENPTDVVTLTARSPAEASIVANGGNFVLAWHIVEDGAQPSTQIWGSVISETGQELIVEKALTEPAQFARYNSLVPLGDRLLLLWSEYRDGRYNIYTRELTPDLDPLGEARPVTTSERDAYGPLAAFGPQGEIGVMYTGVQPTSGRLHVFFTSISCQSGGVDLGLR